MNIPTAVKTGPLNLKEYIEFKLMILIGDFKFKLTDDEIDHMKSLKTEGEVDRYAHELIMKKL